MGGGGQNLLFLPACWSHLLLLVALVPLVVKSMVWQPGLLSLLVLVQHVASVSEDFCQLHLVWSLNSCFPCLFPSLPFPNSEFTEHFWVCFLQGDKQRMIAAHIQKSWFISKATLALLLPEILG